MSPSIKPRCGLTAAMSHLARLRVHECPRRLESWHPHGPSPLPIVQGSVRILGWAIVCLFVVDGRAWALPSPDVVVNLLASAAQVLGLLTVILGKWFFGGRRKNLAAGRSSSSSRTGFLVAAGLFVASLVGWGLYAAHVADLRMRRLQVNITRESKEDGRKIVDLSLKETGFGEQQKREDGFGTDWLEGAIARREPLQMIDIRETEEVEMGVIPGVRAVRFPDLMKDPDQYLDKSRTVFLFCANGNRSAEMTPFLEERGYTSRFLIGGYEKWVAEERHLETPGGIARTELRALPDFPNKDVLLDTPDVMALMQERDVLFVDVRYPGDFETYGHLPGAVNLTLRKLTSPELEAALNALPKKPLIVPCYDRRSSFFASILAVRWTRMGGEFLGRYMAPWDFNAPKKDKGHVASWKVRHEEATLLSIASAPLSGALGTIQSKVPGLAISILILVLLIRLGVLPLTLKADRDRVVQAGLEPRLRALKAELRDDPDALSRAVRKLLRENRIRPVLSLLVAVAQIILFTGFFSVVNEACKDSTQGFLWLPSLGEPDRMFVLPLAISMLLVVQLLITSKKVTKLKIALLTLAAAGLFALVFQLRAGTNLYLVANLSLLVLQTALVHAHFRADGVQRRERRAKRFEGRDVVPLDVAYLVADCGGKASRLAALIEADMPVPDGFVVRGQAIDSWRSTGTWSPGCRKRIHAELTRLGTVKVAVRSSGLNEDGAERSYAGVFESILDVGSEDLMAAIEKVAGSLTSERAHVYSNGRIETGGIVVQAMVPAEYAGVLFTEHPGESGACAVELVAGLGEDLVSGRVDPLSFRNGRSSGGSLDDRKSPIDLAPLIELGRRVEKLFGGPQDIEWAYARGRYFLLQARDITRLCTDREDARAIRERERARLLTLADGAGADQVLLAQNELSELLPEPSPFSLALMQEMWAYGGCTELACRSLGVPFDVLPDSPPFVVGAFGSLYVNRREEERRLRSGPGTLAAFRLSRAAETIERSWREDYLPGFLREMRIREALALSRLTLDELVDLLDRTSREFMKVDYVRAETINVAADFYLKSAVRGLERNGLDPAEHLSHFPHTVVHEAMDRLSKVGRGEAEISLFLDLFGHRAPHDYEIADPRYQEAPSVALAMASRCAGSRDRGASAAPPIGKRVLRLAVERAKRYQALKEEAKHHAMREIAFLRNLVLEIGGRIGIGEGVFYLTPDEVRRLKEATIDQSAVARLVLERQEELEALREVQLPREVTVAALESLDVDHGSQILIPRGSGELRGTRIAGSGDVRGRARILRRAEEIDGFLSGEILVARFTDPTWMSVFPLARGIVTEVGGWLSHAAIQAREYEITGIVGVSGATEVLQNGDLVCLRSDGAIERFGERRGEDRVTVSVPVGLRRGTETVPARLDDLSHHGALLVVQGCEFAVGEVVDLEIPEIVGPLEAAVVRNGLPGVYGMRFHRTLDVESVSAFGAQLKRSVQGAA